MASNEKKKDDDIDYTCTLYESETDTQDKPFLKPGDLIELPATSDCCCKEGHHAIVESYAKEGDGSIKIKVIQANTTANYGYCMVCQFSTQYEFLRPGDHITFTSTCCSETNHAGSETHHAIVVKFVDHGEKKGKIKVIRLNCHDKSKSKIIQNYLVEDKKIKIDLTKITKISVDDRSMTLKKAKQFLKQQDKHQTCIQNIKQTRTTHEEATAMIFQNCEDFVKACTNPFLRPGDYVTVDCPKRNCHTNTGLHHVIVESFEEIGDGKETIQVIHLGKTENDAIEIMSQALTDDNGNEKITINRKLTGGMARTLHTAKQKMKRKEVFKSCEKFVMECIYNQEFLQPGDYIIVHGSEKCSCEDEHHAIVEVFLFMGNETGKIKVIHRSKNDNGDQTIMSRTLKNANGGNIIDLKNIQRVAVDDRSRSLKTAKLIMENQQGNQPKNKLNFKSCEEFVKSCINDYAFLVPGDHIEVPMSGKLGRCIGNHHAIVESFTYEGHGTGRINVIHVSNKKTKIVSEALQFTKGDESLNLKDVKRIDYPKRKYDTDMSLQRAKEYLKAFEIANNSCDLIHNCKDFAMNCSIGTHGTIIISNHEITKVVSEVLTTKDAIKTIDMDFVKRIDFSSETKQNSIPLERARSCFNQSLSQKAVQNLSRFNYNLFVQNCEHFAVACVNGHDNFVLESSLAQSTSLQSVRCFWFTTHVISLLLMCCAYIVNELIYVKFVNEHEHLKSTLNDFSFCFKGKEHDMFYTVCDWYTLLIGLPLLFVIHMTAYLYHCKARSNYICSQCKRTTLITIICKLVCFTAIELFDIRAEVWWASLFKKTSFGAAVSVLVIGSILQSLLIYFVLPYLLVKFIICCIPRIFYCSKCIDKDAKFRLMYS